MGVDLEQGLLDENKKSSGIASLIEGMFDENKNFNPDVTPESVKALFDEMEEFRALNPNSDKVPVDLAKVWLKSLVCPAHSSKMVPLIWISNC